MFMSLTDQTKDGSLTQLEIMQRISRQQSPYPVIPSIKLSSSMKPTTPLPMYNSSLERLLRSSQEIVDSYSPAIIKIKSLNRSTPGVLSSNLASKVKRNKKLQLNSSDVLTGSWTPNGFRVIRKSS